MGLVGPLHEPGLNGKFKGHTFPPLSLPPVPRNWLSLSWVETGIANCASFPFCPGPWSQAGQIKVGVYGEISVLTGFLVSQPSTCARDLSSVKHLAPEWWFLNLSPGMAGMTPVPWKGWDVVIVLGGLLRICGSRVTHHKGNHNNCVGPLVEDDGKVFPKSLHWHQL
jgi:hypothetical protein